MRYKFGDLLLLNYPFSDSSRSKIRPGVVLLDIGGDDVLVARLTSREPHTVHDLVLKEWKAANLPLASVVRLHKMTAISKTQIVAHTGILSEVDREEIFQHLQGMWQK
jgi:mRNA interferase MazF